jgi:hypothetical protein
MKLPKPNSQHSKILHDLISSDLGVTESDYKFHMFRGHISNLRKSLNIRHVERSFKNTFGRKGKYRIHFIFNSEKKKAIKLYLSLVKKAA